MSEIRHMAKTVLLVFAASILGQLAAYGDGVLDLGRGEWRGILASAIAAVVAVVYNWLSPYDPRYGVGAE